MSDCEVKRSCTRYIRGTAQIFFPEDRVCCDLCPMEETYARKQCRLTGQYLTGDTRDVVDADCPLHFENTRPEEDSNE